jgi:hypothetical protein
MSLGLLWSRLCVGQLTESAIYMGVQVRICKLKRRLKVID